MPNGIAYGDVHINTIDGKHYANQAIGEFLLFDNGVAEVQMRTAPWAEESPLQVSIATAFAARIGDIDVSMHADGTTWINDAPADLARGETVALGGGELLWWDQGWVIVWPDGTVLRAQITEVSQLAEITPADGPAIGLLGDFDGDPDNDFFTRDGEVLDPNLDREFDEFYQTYVDSWRITDDESAFHYSDGESTATFSLEGYPSRNATPDDLPDNVRADAEELCGRVGLSNPQMFADCVLDVGATGQPYFAYQAFLAQESTPSPATQSEQPDGSEETNTLVIGDITVAFGPEPPVVDSTGPAPKWTCEVSDGVFTAFSSFPESPTINYDLEVQYIAPNNSRGLNESFRVIVRRNGENYAWVQTAAEQFANAVDSVSLQGATLVASGEIYVNDPPQPGLQPVSPLPGDAELTPFSLQTGCDG